MLGNCLSASFRHIARSRFHALIIALDPWLFVSAAAGALAVALLTVGAHCYIVARANPYWHFAANSSLDTRLVARCRIRSARCAHVIRANGRGLLGLSVQIRGELWQRLEVIGIVLDDETRMRVARDALDTIERRQRIRAVGVEKRNEPGSAISAKVVQVARENDGS